MKRLIFIATLAFPACAKAPPEIVLVEQTPAAVRPSECNPKSDPKWSRLPDSALKKSDIARDRQTNGRAFDTLTGKRRACWDVLTAQK